MNDQTEHDSLVPAVGRRVFLALLALVAPFYFIFPGSVWAEASSVERRLIRRFMIVGYIVYVLVLIMLFG